MRPISPLLLPEPRSAHGVRYTPENHREPVAQSAEQRTFNPKVLGSNPSRLTKVAPRAGLAARGHEDTGVRIKRLAIPLGLMVGTAAAWALGLFAPLQPPMVSTAVLSVGDTRLPPPAPEPANLHPPMPPTEVWSPPADRPDPRLPGPFERFDARTTMDPARTGAWYVAAESDGEGRAWSTDPTHAVAQAAAEPVQPDGEAQRQIGGSGAFEAEAVREAGFGPRGRALWWVPRTGSRPDPPDLSERLPEAGPVPYYSHIAPDRTLPPRPDPR